MNKAIPDYYATLGLPPNATPEQIKKRYRELARRFHPDLNPGPESVNRIKLINAAYHVLGDPERKGAYDAERALRQAAPTQDGGAKAPPRPQPASSRRPEPPQSRVGFNGFGRTYTGPEQDSPPRSSHQTTANRRSSNSFGTLDRLVAEAQLALINHRYREAEEFCRQVLMIDSRCAIAYEILGDIRMKRGQRDEAITAYSYAIQLNPRNTTAQAKLERSVYGKAAPSAPGPTMARRSTGSKWSDLLAGPNGDTYLFVLNMGVIGIWLVVLFLLVPNIGSTIIFSPVIDALFGLLLTGVTSGILLAFNWRMRPIADELMNSVADTTEEQRKIPLGTPLTLLALVWFYLSLAGYLAVVLKRRTISRSVLSVYFVTFAFSCLFAFYPKPLESNAFIFWNLAVDGNILFPAMLLGWMCGDAVRLRRWIGPVS